MVNGDTFRTMITDFFISAFHGIDVKDVWFQQEGATCHTSHATNDLIRQTFDVHWISRNSDFDGSQEAAIWHRGSSLKASVMPSNQT